MSVLRILTKDGFIAFDELLIYQLEEIAFNQIVFPWDDQFQHLQTTLCKDQLPAVIVQCSNISLLIRLIRFCYQYEILFSIRNDDIYFDGETDMTDSLVINIAMILDNKPLASSLISNPI